MSKYDKYLRPNFNPKTGLYKVKDDWIKADEAVGILKNGDYLINPSARNLNDFPVTDGKLHWPEGNTNAGQIVNENFNYVIDKNGNIIIGNPYPNGKDSQKLFHPNLIGGPNPEVKSAGHLYIVDGKAVLIDNQSEHFRPSSKTIETVMNSFKNIPKSDNYFRYEFK